MIHKLFFNITLIIVAIAALTAGFSEGEYLPEILSLGCTSGILAILFLDREE